MGLSGICSAPIWSIFKEGVLKIAKGFVSVQNIFRISFRRRYILEHIHVLLHRPKYNSTVNCR